MKLPNPFKPKVLEEIVIKDFERIRTAVEVVEKDEFGHYVALADIYMLYPMETNYHRFAEKGKRITEYYPRFVRAVDYGWAYKEKSKE